MNCIRKILCKIGMHDDHLQEIIIQPILQNDFNEEGEYLKARNAFMWICRQCKREEIMG